MATENGDMAAVFFGSTQQQEPILLQGTWIAAVAKFTKIRTLMAEVGGTTITGRAKTQVG